MRRAFVILIVMATSLPVAMSQSRSVKSERAITAGASAPRNPFVAGEKLSYDVSWADFIVAGELTIQTDERRSFDAGLTDHRDDGAAGDRNG